MPRRNRERLGLTLVNTSYKENEQMSNDEYDAANMGCDRFGYMSLHDTHTYRDEKDSEAECNLLDFDGEC